MTCSWCPTRRTPPRWSGGSPGSAERSYRRRAARAVRRVGGSGTALGRGARAPGAARRPEVHVLHRRVRRRPVRICRGGTGEHGYELIPAWADTPALWDALLEVVTELGGRPAGLGARDTLRTPMGYPLHGQDLSLDISPVQARAGWAVGWKKDAFWGRSALTCGAGPPARVALCGASPRSTGAFRVRT